MNSKLTDQSVVVVGGTSGMGLAIASLAASRGAYVTVVSRSPDKVAAAASMLGVTGNPLDTTDESSVREFFSAAGQLDHLVVTASSVRTGTLKHSPLEDGEFTFRSKFFGPYLCAKYAQMKPTGSITLFSGILSRRPGHNDVVLAAVNAAVEAMGRALARDLAPIRVNTISPGMTRGTGSYLSMPEAARESMYSAIAARLPVGRVGTAEDIAAATLMLMTNTFITGVTLDVDGGGVLVWTAVRKLGLEGVVGKRSGSRYEPGERSGAWIKLRTNLEQEFVIGGYIPGARGFDALLVGIYKTKKLVFVAKVKNGFVPRVRGELFPAPQGAANCPVPHAAA